MELAKLENHHITRILEEHTLLVTHNVNLVNLKRYLIQYHCIGLMDEERLTRGTSLDNNLELMKVISARGVGAFEGFLAALEHSVQDDPGERGHEELGNVLKRAYFNQKRKLSRDISKQSSTTTASPHSSLLMTSVDSRTQAPLQEEDTAVDKDEVRQPSLLKGSQEPTGVGSTLPLTPYCPTEVQCYCSCCRLCLYSLSEVQSRQDERDGEREEILPDHSSEVCVIQVL